MKKYILFDNDGVLVDTEIWYFEANKKALKELGLTLYMDIYQEIMTLQHHDKPREEAEKIRVQVENLQGQRDSNGRSLASVEGEGIGSLDQQPNRTPVFSG